MKIKYVRTYSRDLGTSRPYSIAYKTVTEVINAFVEIELENGMIGIGAANPSSKVVGESVADTIRNLSNVDFDYLIGKPITAFESLVRQTREKFQHLPGTNVAIDVALHDVFTRFLNIPLVEYFGQQQASLPTSVTIGIKNVAETVAEADEYQGMGFKIIKVKTGLNPEEDAERIVKINERFPNLSIRVDANQGYTPADLEQFVKRTLNVKLELIEQPFPVDRFAQDAKELTEPIARFLVADESLRNPADALHLIQYVPNCKIFNIKLMKTGGLKAASEIANIAALSNVRLMWGCNDESIVSIAAALHLALSFRHTQYIDLDGSLDLIRDVVTGGFLINEGMMRPVLSPGIGIERL